MIDEAEFRTRAWEATSHLHAEPPGPDGRMVTHQPALVEAMMRFAIAEMERVVAHLANQWGIDLPLAISPPETTP